MIVPFPVPEGVTVHHVWLLAAFQEVLDVTVNVVEPAGVAGTFWFGGVTARVLVVVPVTETSSTAHQ